MKVQKSLKKACCSRCLCNFQRMNNKTLVYFGIGVVLILLFFAFNKTTNEKFEATTPLSSIEYVKGKNAIILNQSLNSNINDLFNLNLYQGLKPDMTSDEVEAIIGEPDDTKWKWEMNHNVYYTDEGRIEWGTHRQTGEGYSDFNSILRFYRENIPLDLALTKEVINQLPDKEIKQVYIENDEGIDLYINFSEEEEDYVQWVYTEHSGN